MSVQDLLDRLECVKQSGPDKWIARCPAHDDGRPSLSIRETGDGTVLIRCFAGCTAEEIVSAKGLRLSDLFPESSSRPKRPRINTKERDHERMVLEIARADITRGVELSEQDEGRIKIAMQRLEGAA